MTVFNAKQYPAYRLGFDAFNAQAAGECSAKEAFDRIADDASITAKMAFVDGWSAAADIYDANQGTGAFVTEAAEHVAGAK